MSPYQGLFGFAATGFVLALGAIWGHPLHLFGLLNDHIGRGLLSLGLFFHVLLLCL
jgi:hypothetical protein